MKKILILSLIAITGLMTSCSSNSETPINTTISSSATTATNNSPAKGENSATDENKNVTDQPTKNANSTAKKEETSVPNKSVARTDKTERVQFGGGKTDGSYTRDIPAEGSIDFVMNGKKGQTIGYTVGYDFKDSDVEAFLTEPGLQDISQTAAPKEPKEFTINKSGDHRLTVNNTTKKKVTITLYLDIQ